MPDRNLDLRDKLAWMVETQGYAVEPVKPINEPGVAHPGYTFTVGFEATWGHPEVVIWGLAPSAARAARPGGSPGGGRHRAAGGSGLRWPVGERPALGPARRRRRTRRRALSRRSGFYSERPFRMLQFVWPDRAGMLPWEEGYDERLRLAHPVIGHW